MSNPHTDAKSRDIKSDAIPGGGPQLKAGMDTDVADDIAPGEGASANAAAVNHAPHILGFFDGMTFPASKMELVAYAEDAEASEDVLDHLQAIPDDIYNSLTDLERHFNDIEIIEESGNLWSSEESHDIGMEPDPLLADLTGNDIHIK
jgi:hypothetical protein